MKANSFKEIKVRKAKPKVKSRISNGRCAMTGKVPMGKNKAEGMASRLSPDDRGGWVGYKCPYGKSHFHIGHSSKGFA